MTKAHWETKHTIPKQMRTKKMWCRNCGRLKEKSVCECGKSVWSASKIL